MQVFLWAGVTAVNTVGQKHGFVYWLSGIFMFCFALFIACDVGDNWANLGMVQKGLKPEQVNVIVKR